MAAPTTVHSGSFRRFLAVDLLRERGFQPRNRSASPPSPRRRAPVSAWPASARACSPARSTRSVRLVDRDGVALQDVLRPPDGSRTRTPGPHRLLHRAAHRAGPRADLDPVGVASAIWPHGRWRFDFTGEPNHAGTTLMSDRRDPMLAFAFTVLAADKEARLRAGARHDRAGGRRSPTPPTRFPRASPHGSTPARGDRDHAGACQGDRGQGGRACRPRWHPVDHDRGVDFARDRFDTDAAGPDRGAARTARRSCPPGAGHDAGVLGAHVPTAMLFVRNPTGVSHARPSSPPTKTARPVSSRSRRPSGTGVLTDIPRWPNTRGWRESVRGRCRSTSVESTASHPSGVDGRHRRDDTPEGLDVSRPRQRALARLPPGASRPHARRQRRFLDVARADVLTSPPNSTRTPTTRWLAATFAEMALAGITSVGEFHYLHHGPGGAAVRRPERDGPPADRGRGRGRASGSR